MEGGRRNEGTQNWSMMEKPKGVQLENEEMADQGNILKWQFWEKPSTLKSKEQSKRQRILIRYELQGRYDLLGSWGMREKSKGVKLGREE